MRGFITERDFDQAEAEFPGIRALFEACAEKPRTFIDLLARYLRELRTTAEGEAV
jgi:hypothetical protein